MNAPYRNAKLSLDDRVDDLLGRMTLEEHLSGQRTNGLRSMVERIRKLAAEA